MSHEPLIQTNPASSTASNPLHPELQRTVLLGLSRAPLLPQALALNAVEDEAHQASLSALPADIAIWQTLATRALMNRAGYLPSPVNMRLTPALPDIRLPCPQQVAHIFALMQKDIHAELLDEWLFLLQRHGYGMPHAQLPALFELGRKRSHLRQDILSVADQRGAWLLAQHSTWGDFYLDQQGDRAKDWSTGTVKKRAEAFRVMRMQDPAAALAALQQEWPAESVESRSTLLPLLAVRLSMADEPFLESVLDDPRKDIRQSAQQLLRSLPASRLVQRCTAYTATLLQLEKKLLRGHTLSVTMPETDNAALLRDGIYPERYRNLGDKASILLYLVATTPPSYWLNLWQLTPQKLLTLFSGHEYQAALLTGLLQACVQSLQHDPKPDSAQVELYLLLLERLAQDMPLLELNPRGTLAFNTLPPQQQAQTLQQWLATPSQDAAQARAILGLCRQAITSCRYAQIEQWPLTLSALVARQIRTLMQTNNPLWGMDAEFSNLARSILHAAEVEQLHGEISRLPAGLQASWERALDGLRELIHFRTSLQQAFQP